VLDNAAAVKNWDAGGIEAPIPSLTFSNENLQPSPCFVLRKIKSKVIVYDKAVTQPSKSIWKLQPQERRASDRATAATTELLVSMGPGGPRRRVDA
jgi:hypothetical protein